jgi:hypothetical protein
MPEMKEASDVAIDNIRFAMQGMAMTGVGLGGLTAGTTSTAIGVMMGLLLSYWSTKFHPDTVTINIPKSWT